MDKRLKLKMGTIKILKESIGIKKSDISHTNIFTDTSLRTMESKEKINKWGYIKLKSFCTAKETTNKITREPTAWENIFVNVTSNKGLISKIYREPIQLNKRKTNNSIKKGAKGLNRHFSKVDIQMAKRYMKKCSRSLITLEMQIKTTIRYYLIPVRMAIINKSTNNKCWRGFREKEILLLVDSHCWWECRLVQPLWKTVWRFLKKLKMELPFDPVIPLLGIYSKKPETPVRKDICTPMFIAAQFTIAKIWKHPRCP
uniref:Uncharacterized protein n=1 Tax=Myotis myotis TaxID=51298 RepID=A0A7J7ZZ06_MYOMY|nr:hypothetical protein mMyoMyo1_009833 [Myotis myotis]